MSGEFGTGKTIFVLAIVVGCFAVLWPKIFYPMLTASVKQPAPARQEGPHARPERPAHLYPEMVHPALREKGRAMPQRTLDKQARPGPMPGVRPPMGGAGGIMPPPQSKGSGAMGIIMPLYTVGIVVFFVYTIMKVLFKKGPDDDKTPKLKDFGLDPEYRKYVFAEEYLDNADASTRDQIRRQQREDSRAARRKFQQEMQQGVDSKIGARGSRTQNKMETKGKKLGEWYLPEGFLSQSLDQDSDTDFTIGGASINESARETYRDRLLAGLGVSAQESLWPERERRKIPDIPETTRQEILNLLGEKYGFYMNEEEEEEQYEEAAIQDLIYGPLSKGDSSPRKPLQMRQRTLDLSVLNDESAVTEKVEGDSGSETVESHQRHGFQARQNTLEHSEFKEQTQEDHCSVPGFLEELQEGLRRRGMEWRMNSEENLYHNNEHSHTGTSENLADAPLESNISSYSGDYDSDGSCTTPSSHVLPPAAPSEHTHSQGQRGEQAKTDCDKKDEQLDHLRRRLEETERAMERLMSQMGSVTDKLTAAKITEVLSQAQFQAKILKEEVSEITSEEEPSSEQFTATLSEDTSLPTSLRHHLQELQKPEESPTSSKGSSPDMDEYEVITKEDSTTTTTTSTPSQDTTKTTAAAATAATTKESGPQTQPSPAKPPAPPKSAAATVKGQEKEEEEEEESEEEEEEEEEEESSEEEEVVVRVIRRKVVPQKKEEEESEEEESEEEESEETESEVVVKKSPATPKQTVVKTPTKPATAPQKKQEEEEEEEEESEEEEEEEEEESEEVVVPQSKPTKASPKPSK